MIGRMRQKIGAAIRRLLGGKPRPDPSKTKRPTPQSGPMRGREATEATPSTRSDPEELFSAFLQNQIASPQPPQTHRRLGAEIVAGKTAVTDRRLATLEANLRAAVLDRNARERLVTDAMARTTGGRAAAIQKVLDDLRDEDRRWS